MTTPKLPPLKMVSMEIGFGIACDSLGYLTESQAAEALERIQAHEGLVRFVEHVETLAKVQFNNAKGTTYTDLFYRLKEDASAALKKASI